MLRSAWFVIKTSMLIFQFSMFPSPPPTRLGTDWCGRGRPPYDTAGVRCFGARVAGGYGADHGDKDSM